MAAVALEKAKIGASLLCSGAILGTAVSIANYFSPDSGIAGTPGALLVIVSTVILLAFGLIMRSDVKRGGGLSRLHHRIGTFRHRGHRVRRLLAQQ